MSASRGSPSSSLRSASPLHGSGLLTHTPSHELLTVHPLLSPDKPTALGVAMSSEPLLGNDTTVTASQDQARTAPGTSPSSVQPSVSAVQKYLPYTPRHNRSAPGAATTGTASSPVSVSPLQPQLQHATATSRLQLQNLKASAQSHGLDSSSLGWTMLEELVGGTDHSPGWSEVWSTVANGQVTLLLPTEHASGREPVTAELLKDHIVFCNGSSTSSAPLVTLSGLRGLIDEKSITFQSVIPSSSKSFSALNDPVKRPQTLQALPPLPTFSNPALSYPQITLSTFASSLPLPSRPPPPTKPPLPPRPGIKGAPASNVSRLANPFASFFSKSPTLSSPSALTQALPPEPIPDHVVEVSAFIVDHPLIRGNTAKGIAKCMKAEVKDTLEGLPAWVIERSQSFVSDFLPFPKPAKKVREDAVDVHASDQKVLPTVSGYDDPAEDISQKYQSFYESLDEELRVEGSPSTLRRKENKASDEERERHSNELDSKVRNTLEKVERAVTATFYDRLFRPSNSDDASHDEALSSRIAALNMLDLTLEHLGVECGEAREDVLHIVEACGETITQLEVARCPADKSAILIAAHRILVDGLSRLPPLELKSEDAIEDDKTPQTATFSRNAAANNETPAIAPEVTLSPESIPAELPPASRGLSKIDTSDAIKTPMKEDAASMQSVPSFQLTPADEKESPLLSMSPQPPSKKTVVSGDILLPLIIFSVVKANPPQLVSHLLFTQRFRNQSFGGEESYCLINLMAVVEFLENVDLAALGLKESENKVMSTADLSPIPLALVGEKSGAAAPGIQAGLRGRVEQQVDAIAGSANKVLSGVVDSGFGVLRSLLPVGQVAGDQTPGDGAAESAPWNISRPGFGLLRRESGFSIASLAASLPGRERGRSFASSHHPDEEGQEMIESRPSSVRNLTMEDKSEGSGESESDDEGEDDDEDEEDDDEGPRHDARSIRSFESMMSRKNRASKLKVEMKKERMSLSDRLAHMSRLSKGATSVAQENAVHHGSPPARSSSLLAAREATLTRQETPLSSRNSSPIPSSRVQKPSKRFLECSPDDIKVGEIPELLAEYKRMAETLRFLGCFDDA